jgi:hypothetical protein
MASSMSSVGGADSEVLSLPSASVESGIAEENDIIVPAQDAISNPPEKHYSFVPEKIVPGTPLVTNEAAKIKVKMGESLLENLTIEEVTAMAEDGQLKEHHLIARQFSENWVVAPNVPALRPIFERLRADQEQIQAPQSPPPQQAGKRGLFSGLFGRK